MPIAQIEGPRGRHAGTGLLVNASEFFENPGGERVLLTNWHVVSKDGEDPSSVPPTGQRLTLRPAASGKLYRLKEVVAFSRCLDASFVSLEPVDPQIDYCPLRIPPAEFDQNKKQRVCVIRYPGGRGLSFSLHDSLWLDSDATKLHHRTPTEGGSSGSPVFDEDNWMLVGLLHGGSKNMPRLKGRPGTYEANEAFSFAAIRDAIRANPMA